MTLEKDDITVQSIIENGNQSIRALWDVCHLEVKRLKNGRENAILHEKFLATK